jgi:acyl-CoA synthetase (AMP-forming)/AMP-acid ligase II
MVNNSLQLSNNKQEFSNLIDLLTYRAALSPQHNIYTFLQRLEEVGSLTFADLDKKARAIAAYLQSLGVAKERALMLYPSSLDFIEAFFGCLYAEIVAVPAYPPRRNQTLVRLTSIISDAQAKIILSPSALKEDIKCRLEDNDILKDVIWVSTDTIDEELAEKWQRPYIDSNTLAFLQYTSGSTSKPKGVMVSHGNLLHNEQMIQQAFGHTENTLVVGWLPLFHDMGLIGNMLQPLYLGKHCVFMSPVDFLQKPVRWIQAVSKYKATTSGGPNSAYDLVCQKIKPDQLEHLDLSSWEVAFTGAETIRAETLEKFAKIFAPCGFRYESFYPCYGMAETTLMVSGKDKSLAPTIKIVKGTALENNQIVPASKEQDNVRKIVGCGQTWMNQKIIIADPQTLRQCSPEQVGEIWVSGESVTQGYWQRVEETKASYQAYLADTGDGPFLRTGDLGFLEDGELFFTGRLKDLVIIQGQNFYPQDIEYTVQKSHPALRKNSGAAFSVELEGQEHLVIVQELEREMLMAFKNKQLNEEQIIKNIRLAVTAEYALNPHEIVLIKPGTIPKTSSGKIQRNTCRTQFIEKNLTRIS